MCSSDLDEFDPDTIVGIFHFSTMLKPWMAWSPEPPRRLYQRYARLSPLRMPEIAEPTTAAHRVSVELLERAARRRGRTPEIA